MSFESDEQKAAAIATSSEVSDACKWLICPSVAQAFLVQWLRKSGAPLEFVALALMWAPFIDDDSPFRKWRARMSGELDLSFQRFIGPRFQDISAAAMEGRAILRRKIRAPNAPYLASVWVYTVALLAGETDADLSDVPYAKMIELCVRALRSLDFANEPRFRRAFSYKSEHVPLLTRVYLALFEWKRERGDRTPIGQEYYSLVRLMEREESFTSLNYIAAEHRRDFDRDAFMQMALRTPNSARAIMLYLSQAADVSDTPSAILRAHLIRHGTPIDTTNMYLNTRMSTDRMSEWQRVALALAASRTGDPMRQLWNRDGDNALFWRILRMLA